MKKWHNVTWTNGKTVRKSSFDVDDYEIDREENGELLVVHKRDNKGTMYAAGVWLLVETNAEL